VSNVVATTSSVLFSQKPPRPCSLAVKLPTIHYPLSTLFCLLVLLAGCPKADSDSNKKPAALRFEGVTLRLAVADDPALAAAVERVKGEWNAQTGSELEVVKTTGRDLLRADGLPADAVLCPSRLLADLAERGRLAPVLKPILHDPEWAGVFPLVKLREAVWGNQTMAVPFGSPVFCCYYRADLLEKLGRRPPKTWDEYQSLAKLLADNAPQSGEGQDKKNSPRPLGEGQGVRAWCGTIEPLAPGWAGLVLLARAAPYAKHRNNYSALFDVETMEPLVSSPPFVQALEELVAAAKLGPTDSLHHDPASVRAAFWNGRCGMALTWPTAAEKVMVEKAAAAAATTGGLRVGFAELPGSPRVFNPTNRLWDRRPDGEDRRVSLISIAGRLGVVAKESANTDAAFQLLLWLSGSQMSPQTSAASPATTLFRKSNLESPGAWVEKPIPAPAAVQYADATETALSHKQWLGALRLPGASEYLAALDSAVAAAVQGKKLPLEALTEASAKWKEITKRLGAERQRAAYRHSVGLE
jgi:multiple sugar transport system substrate-binding protein